MRALSRETEDSLRELIHVRLISIVVRVTCRHGKILVRIVLYHLISIHKILRLVPFATEQVFLVELMDGLILNISHCVRLNVAAAIGVLLDDESSGSVSPSIISRVLIELAVVNVMLNLVRVVHVERVAEALVTARASSTPHVGSVVLCAILLLRS